MYQGWSHVDGPGDSAPGLWLLGWNRLLHPPASSVTCRPLGARIEAKGIGLDSGHQIGEEAVERRPQPRPDSLPLSRGRLGASF